VLFDAVLLFFVFFFPWWYSVVFIFIGGLIFQNFFEGLVAGVLMDALYGTEAVAFYGFRLFFSSYSLLAIIITDFLKRKIRFLE
jgi:hypothetical protein